MGMTRSERVVRTVFAGVCGYEAIAIGVRLLDRPAAPVYLPTLSGLCQWRREIEVGLLAILLMHLHYKITTEVAAEAAEEAVAGVVAEITE